MTKDELLSRFKRNPGKAGVLELAAACVKDEAFVVTLIDLCFNSDKVVAFRASWVLENIFFNHQQVFLRHLDYFLSRYPEQKNDSCRRHFSKIMMEIALFEAGSDGIDWGPVIEATFGWLSEASCPVAVQANCMDILCFLKDEDDWIAEELEAQIAFILKGGTAAVQSRGKRVLERLGRNKK